MSMQIVKNFVGDSLWMAHIEDARWRMLAAGMRRVLRVNLRVNLE